MNILEDLPLGALEVEIGELTLFELNHYSRGNFFREDGGNPPQKNYKTITKLSRYTIKEKHIDYRDPSVNTNRQTNRHTERQTDILSFSNKEKTDLLVSTYLV